MPDRNEVGVGSDDDLDHRPARHDQAVEHEDDELEQRPRMHAVVHDDRAHREDHDQRDGRATAPPTTLPNVSSPCSRTQVTTSTTNNGGAYRDASLHRSSPTVDVCAGRDQVGRRPFAQPVQRPGRRSRWRDRRPRARRSRASSAPATQPRPASSAAQRSALPAPRRVAASPASPSPPAVPAHAPERRQPDLGHRHQGQQAARRSRRPRRRPRRRRSPAVTSPSLATKPENGGMPDRLSAGSEEQQREEARPVQPGHSADRAGWCPMSARSCPRPGTATS